MRIQLWQAFASNHSGSDTIVGRFDDAATAAAVAAELDEVIGAHSAWHREHPWDDTEGSPLQAFVQARQPTWQPGLGASDDWPDYGDDPVALAVGAQLVVYVSCTVSMPRTLGDLIEARGGTVETCLNHAHHPLIVRSTPPAAGPPTPRSTCCPVWRTRASSRSSSAAASRGCSAGSTICWPGCGTRRRWRPA